MKCLCDLLPGEEGRISDFDTSTPTFIKNRMLSLGFVPGTLVRIVRKAPLGDPVEYELRGSRISLRKSEAELLNIAE